MKISGNEAWAITLSYYREEGMNIYKIFLSASDTEPEVLVTADDEAEALENVKCVPGVECYITSTAYAVRMEGV